MNSPRYQSAKTYGCCPTTTVLKRNHRQIFAGGGGVHTMMNDSGIEKLIYVHIIQYFFPFEIVTKLDVPRVKV